MSYDIYYNSNSITSASIADTWAICSKESFKEDRYKVPLTLNHNQEVYKKLESLAYRIFEIDYSGTKNDADDNLCRKVAARALIYIPLALSHACSLIKDTTLTVAYAVAAIFLTVAMLGSFGSFENLNLLTKRTWVYSLDSLCNIGIDIVGCILPFQAYSMSKTAYFAMKNLIRPEPE